MNKKLILSLALLLGLFMIGKVNASDWVCFTATNVYLSSGSSLEVTEIRWDKGDSAFNTAFLVLVDTSLARTGTTGTSIVHGNDYAIGSFPLGQHLIPPVMLFTTATATGLYAPNGGHIDLTDPVTGNGVPFYNGLTVFKSGGAAESEIGLKIRKRLDRSQILK